jgi:hypothetical protein
LLKKTVKRLATINTGFSFAQQVKVGTVDDGNFHVEKLKIWKYGNARPNGFIRADGNACRLYTFSYSGILSIPIQNPPIGASVTGMLVQLPDKAGETPTRR